MAIEKKTNNNKQRFAQDKLTHRDIVCVSNKMIKWCKNYLNRSTRRKQKQDIKKEIKEYD